jgi:hypothetical protein
MFSVKLVVLAASMVAGSAMADEHSADGKPVPESVILEQRAKLAANTAGKGFGPQSPRDLRTESGENPIDFSEAPDYDEMNLCNIHFHESAEHAGGEFSKFAGSGDGHGSGTGFVYSGELSSAELAPITEEVCDGKYGSLKPGDTIEVHYVHSSAMVTPGPTLGACLNDAVSNPQLRVEAQVYVLVNDDEALDFAELTELGMVDGYHQALNIPANTGEPIEYDGSTTGPGYNEKGSPLQVSWSVRPKVAKVNIATVGRWCEGNVFNEGHAHGVRNLVVNPELISDLDE